MAGSRSVQVWAAARENLRFGQVARCRGPSGPAATLVEARLPQNQDVCPEEERLLFRECFLWHGHRGCALLGPPQVALKTHRQQALSARAHSADKRAEAQSTHGLHGLCSSPPRSPTALSRWRSLERQPPWKLVRNGSSWAPSQTWGIRTLQVGLAGAGGSILWIHKPSR